MLRLVDQIFETLLREALDGVVTKVSVMNRIRRMSCTLCPRFLFLSSLDLLS
jgi:hypothetical protein